MALASLTIRILLAVASVFTSVADVIFTEEDANLSTPEIILKYGYNSEVHNIETQDGYIIELHRVRSSPVYGPANPYKLPVLLMHGLMGSSADWILMGPEESLPYLLSDQGHDVWLGNARGNRYSRNHTHLSPEGREFWDFTFHEIGLYDLPVMVDHVLAQTGQPQLHYVGHSQGTTMFFVLNALRPEYNRKFRLMHALAPAVFLTHLQNPFLRFLAQHETAALQFVNFFGIFEVKPYQEDINRLAKALCPDFYSRALCLDAMHTMTGNKYHHMSQLGFPMLLRHLPAGCSLKQVAHFGQVVTSGHFRPYDYGVEENRRRYTGSAVPPDYDLTKVTAPVVIFYGLADQLTHPTDVRQLAGRLPNLVALNQLPNTTFNHMDFLLAGDAKDALYDSIIGNVEQA
ncbi:lipase 1-like [Anopheles merus]|uniref:lipase 1-like n=1 Tax=Anopheles merus TaxID=30066 RepID=UPI001BE463A8|nr:lipase 1-like [Anopheles merus]